MLHSLHNGPRIPRPASCKEHMHVTRLTQVLFLEVQAAPLSLFTAGLDGRSFAEQVAMVRRRATLQHQRLSQGALTVDHTAPAVL